MQQHGDEVGATIYCRHTELDTRCCDHKNSGKSRSIYSNHTKIKKSETNQQTNR